MSRRRLLLLGVAALLSVSALLAIAVLLVGRFGRTEGRILGTTALLAGYGLVALPGVVLLDQGRSRKLALATAALAAVAAVLALASVWGASDSDSMGRSVGTATVFALAAAQTAALAARRQQRDPVSVRRLFGASCGIVGVAAATGAALIWANPHDATYPRLFGALVVLDLLLVSLQPVLARARPELVAHRFAVVLSSGETFQVTIESGDLASAAAKAIRAAEEGGDHVVRLEISQNEIRLAS
jgi:hypothetical protein